MEKKGDPKYDNDLVNLGYLKKRIGEFGSETEGKIQQLPKNYSSPPIPPYFKDSVLTYQNKIYICIKDRTIGNFNLNDWKVVATDDTELNDFIKNEYNSDILHLQEQLDGKIESFYQNTNPALVWTTDVEKSKHVGDFWYNTTDNTQWRYSRITTNPITYTWQEVNVPIAIYNLIGTKKSIYTLKPNSYNKDDMWIIEEEISDEDITIGTEDNPIKKGDWVFSLNNRDFYNKADWVKKDENISKEYLENHYYTSDTIENKITEINADVDSKISKSKMDIILEVEGTYTTKEETTKAVNDFDKKIGELTETVETNKNTISSLTVEQGRITETVESVEEKTETLSGNLGSLEGQVNQNKTETDNNLKDINNKFNNYATTESVTQVTNKVNEITTSNAKLIEFQKTITENGVEKLNTKTGIALDTDGMHIDKDGAKTGSTFDEAGVTIIDKSGTQEELNFYSGYVDDDIVNKFSQLESYKGTSLTYTMNLLVKVFASFPNFRIQETYDETHGQGLGVFHTGGDS